MNVFMFHFGRCGSTALATVIARIPGFFWHGEIFTEGTHVYDGFEKLEISKKKGGGIFDCHEFLEFIRIAKRGAENQIGHPFLRYGCEIKSYNFEYNYFRFSLEDAVKELASEFPDARFIFLRRRNALRRILSAIQARETGIYHVTTSIDSPKRFAIDLDNFEDADLNFRGDISSVLSNSLEAERHYADALNHVGGFEICYEDHIDQSMEGAISLLDAKLGTGLISPETHLKKTNPFPLSEVLINYEELRLRLSSSNFDWMIY